MSAMVFVESRDQQINNYHFKLRGKTNRRFVFSAPGVSAGVPGGNGGRWHRPATGLTPGPFVWNQMISVSATGITKLAVGAGQPCPENEFRFQQYFTRTPAKRPLAE